MDRQEFIERIIPMALEGYKKYGILPSLCIAQACLESNFGTRHMGDANNYFGFKVSRSWKGKTITLPTKEWDGKKMISVQAKFRAYDTLEDSVNDYLRLIGTVRRYQATCKATDYLTATREVYRAGYATDPKYPQKLQKIIEEYNLKLLDKKVQGVESMSKIIRDLNELHPNVRKLAEKLVDKCTEEDIKIIVIETYRNNERQNELYSRGRKTKGSKVTNAKAGQSIHNYRLAFDICPMVNGKCAWDRTDLFDRVGAIGESLGLTWGGHFKTITDKAHFQWTGGLKLKDLQMGKYPNAPEEKDWRIKQGLEVIERLDKSVMTSPDYWKRLIEKKPDFGPVLALMENMSRK
jgi:hypothetical protein